MPGDRGEVRAGEARNEKDDENEYEDLLTFLCRFLKTCKISNGTMLHFRVCQMRMITPLVQVFKDL